MAAISMDLRVRIFDAREAGETTSEVAERFAVSPAFVRRLVQRYRATGSLAPPGGRRPGPTPRLAADADRLLAEAAAHPGLTARELRDRLGLAAAPLTVWRMLRRLGLTHKKSPSAPPSRTGRTCGRPGPGGRPRSPAGPPAG